jgi:hypothetical protein
MKRDTDKILADLEAADLEVEATSEAYEQATTKRTGLILEAAAANVSKATIARHLNLSPNRVQQIMDRVRSRKVNLDEVNFRINVRGDGDEIKLALLQEESLILFGGHGPGSTAPGDDPIPITNWTIYGRAESEALVRTEVERAFLDLDPPPQIVSVEPFNPNG